ncbi:hypothetical protein KQI84_12925 [bacterium]|nr:hypothetical protein [bacterium]
MSQYGQSPFLNPKIIGAVAGVVVLVLIGTMLRGRPIEEAGPFREPIQRALAQPTELPAPDGYIIMATDEYSVEAMVMSRRRYWFDEHNGLSPIDLLLVWGRLTVEPNLSGIKWKQGMRWGMFEYKYSEVDVGQREIEIHSANTHIIPPPDDPVVRRTLMKLDRGDTVRLSGYLVKVKGTGGFHWNSSRTRTDTGAGACELFYVTDVEPI